MSRLAAYFHVAWVNCPQGWRDAFSKMGRRPTALSEVPASPAALHIYQPDLWLPLLAKPARLARWTARERLRRACRMLRERGCSKIVLYIWRPEFGDAIDLLPHDLSIYHVDDEYSFSAVEMPVSPEERKLLQSVGQVFIHSPALMEKRGAFNPNTEFVPNGVDYSLYATPAAEPEDLRSIPHPRIGYVGYLKQMLDWQLLLELSSRHPQWSFVFVGPTRPHPAIFSLIEELSRRQNVHFLGGKPVERLAAYTQHFDVCVMPYKVYDYTNYIYPLKMHEYLATGRPVVSAPIRSVKEFSSVIALAAGAEEWSHAIAHALTQEENSIARRTARQAVAREHDWDTLVLRIARTIAERLHVDVGSAETNESQLLSLSAPLR
jgi:glycosyltransferase involved in cell wall biosynthesis